MSWVSGEEVFSAKTKKAEILNHLHDVAESHRCGKYEPQVEEPIYYNHIAEDYKQALEYLRSKNKRTNLVCQFKGLNEKGKEILNKKLKLIDDKIAKAYLAFSAELAQPFLTCPKCNAKLDVEMLNRFAYCCPIKGCGGALSEAKENQKSKKLKEIYENLKKKREQVEEESTKLMIKYQENKQLLLFNIYVS